MNILLWVLQVLLALHTLIGAVWKFSNSEQTVPSLTAIPYGVWLVLGVIEVLCAIGLIFPAFNKRLSITSPVAAILIAIEMLLFTILNIFSANLNYGHIIYWLIVAAVCGFIVYGSFMLKPIK